MRVLTVNAGSSSLKLRLLDASDSLVERREVEQCAGRIERDELASVIAAMGPIDAVGHRVVHGGATYTEPVRVDPKVRTRLEDFVPLAPLHQPAALEGIDAVAECLPQTPAVACFDTAFHRTLPPEAYTYAIPAEYRDRYGLRRYGFHGLSHSYASRRAAELIGRSARDLRTVVCHLGAGASLAAVRHGRSVDTTMGFTPLEGVVMATRSGSIDPGMLLWLQRRGGLDAAELDDALNHRSGLAALAGTPDMRVVLERAGRGDEAAASALRVHARSVRSAIAAMAAAMGGLDVLVFTAGIGERSAPVRAAVTEGLAFLGIGLDEHRNAAIEGDGEIGADGVPVRTVVVVAREDLEIARGVRATLTA